MENKTGILITHGTDTLSWTHAFVRYSIKNNHANIVITGSQIPMPSLGEFSDAYENLNSSMHCLTSLKPPNILTVFNYGKEAFSDSLRKIDRWENDTFRGDVVARIQWDEIKYHDESVEIRKAEKLDQLYILTTGGTIESEPNEEGVLVPKDNHVLPYITRKFANYFKELHPDNIFVIDSSDNTFSRMFQICSKVEKCLQESNKDAFADTKFDQKIRIVYLDPFKKEDDYRSECEDANGVIFAGYGGGNLTIDNREKDYNIIPLIEDLIENNKPIILTSQVPLGTEDFIYRNADDPVKLGVIPGIDLSIPECQVRLSYILGHKQVIDEFDETNSFMQVVDRLFTSGMKFRTRKSKEKYEKMRRFQVIKEDILINKTFSESLKHLDFNYSKRQLI